MILSVLLVALACIGVSGVHLKSHGQSHLHTESQSHLQSKRKTFMEDTSTGSFGCPDIQWVKTATPTAYTVRWCYSGSGCTVEDDYIWVTVVSTNVYMQCRPEPIKIFETIFGWATSIIGIFLAPEFAEMGFGEFLGELFKEGVSNGIDMGRSVGDNCYCFPERWTDVQEIYTTITTNDGASVTIEVPPAYFVNVNAERVKQNTLLKIRTETCNNAGWNSRICSNTYLRTRRTLSWSDLMDEIAWLGDRGTQPQSFALWQGGDITNSWCGVQPGRKQAGLARQWCFSTSCVRSDDHIDVSYNGWAEIRCENPFSMSIPAVGMMIMDAYKLQADWTQNGGCLCYPVNYDNTPYVVWVHDESGDQSHFHIPPSQFYGLDEDTITFGVKLASQDCTAGNWQTNICSKYAGAGVKYEYDWDELGDDIAWWGDRNADPDGLYRLVTTDLVYAPTTPVAAVCTTSNPCLTDIKTLSAANLKINDAYEIVNVYSGTCLDMPGSSQSAGIPTDIWQCTGGLNQRFRLIPSNDEKSYRIQFVHSTMCLQNTMYQAACTVDDTDKKQLWTLTQTGTNKEFWTISSVLSPTLYLDLSGLGYTNGSLVKTNTAKVTSKNIKNGVQWTQVWYLRKKDAPNPNSQLCNGTNGNDICVSNTGAFKLNPGQMYDIVSATTKLCLSQFADNSQPANPFTQDVCINYTDRPNNEMNEYFRFKPTPANSSIFTIQVLHDSMCVDISSTGKVVQNPCNSNSRTQLFTLQNYGAPKELWTIKPVDSNNILVLTTDKSAEYLSLGPYQPPRLLGLRTEYWYIRRRGAIDWDPTLCTSPSGDYLCSSPASENNDLYYVISADANKCLTVPTLNVGDKPILANCSFGASQQLFKFQLAFGSTFRMQSIYSGLCITPQNYTSTYPQQLTCYTGTSSNIGAWMIAGFTYYGVSDQLFTLNDVTSLKDLTSVKSTNSFIMDKGINAGVPPISHLFYFRKDLPAVCSGSQKCAKNLDATMSQYISFLLLNLNGGICLEALPDLVNTDFPMSGGTQQKVCTGDDSQDWEFHRFTDGSFELQNTISGLCLARTTDKTTVTTSICMNTVSPPYNKRSSWVFENPLGGYYWKMKNVDTGTYLDLTSGIQLKPSSDSQGQLFLLVNA